MLPENLSESICLTCQVWITIWSIRNLIINRQEYPIKQLSPTLTMVVSICFLIANLIILIKQLQPNSCSILIFIMYHYFKELAIIIFCFRTFKVYSCYTQIFPKQFFSDNLLILMVSSILSILIVSLLIIIDDASNNKQKINNLWKYTEQQGIFDVVLIFFNHSILLFAYSVSSKTYIDYKGYLIWILFIISSQNILKIILDGLDCLDQFDYHFHLMIMNLVCTIVIAIFTSDIKEADSLPTPAVLQNFNGFINYSIGLSTLQQFAKYFDSSEQNSQKRKSIEMLSDYIYIDHLMKKGYLQQLDLELQRQHILNILNDNSFLHQEISDINDLSAKINQPSFDIWKLKRIQAELFQYCSSEIFNQWKRTKSYKFFQREFYHNSEINQRMEQIDIQIG